MSQAKNINSMNVHYSRLRQLQIYNRYIKIFQRGVIRELDVKDTLSLILKHNQSASCTVRTCKKTWEQIIFVIVLLSLHDENKKHLYGFFILFILK